MLYAILGIVQGLTEFLPLSSSGHLVLFGQLFAIEPTQILPIIIVCHMGTLFALLCFFARDIWAALKDLVLISQIIVVSLVTGIIAFLGKDFFEELFQRPTTVCLALFLTAVLLIRTSNFKKGRKNIFALTFKDALCLGISQGLAIIPGISRSGITIFTLLARGAKAEAAFKFSFISGIPAMLGSFLLEAKMVSSLFNHSAVNFWLAFGFSFIFGILSLLILKRLVKNLQLHYFGYYLVVVSVLGLILIK